MPNQEGSGDAPQPSGRAALEDSPGRWERAAPPALRAGSPARGGLTARGLGKTYKKRPVVRNVELNVRRGEAVGLLGPERRRKDHDPST